MLSKLSLLPLRVSHPFAAVNLVEVAAIGSAVCWRRLSSGVMDKYGPVVGADDELDDETRSGDVVLLGF